jgi:glycosyltransferase involved in cell wall biosynthesis
MVEKKAPHLTIQAFAAARRRHPAARLRIIGYGPLMDACRSLVRTLDLADAVTFLGPQPPDVVRAEMRAARGFVQHSVQAASGDCEGLPVGILEAAASGLPVVATRHAGIPEAVLDGDTGILVDEKDVDAMALAMERILDDAGLAARMGRRGQAHVREHFSMERSIGQLWSIVNGAALRPHA